MGITEEYRIKHCFTYLKSTKDDLRNPYGKLPHAAIEGLQILLFMSANTERHVFQIEEIMVDENSPIP